MIIRHKDLVNKGYSAYQIKKMVNEKKLFFVKKGYGKIYVRGLLRGVSLCSQKKGQAKKVRFEWKNLPHYIWIQLELWWNLLRRLYEFV